MKIPVGADAGDSSFIVARLESILSLTGYVIPTVVVGVIVLAIMYPDRLAFTRPHPKAVYVPPGALPILGHTLEVVKFGTARQFERFHEMTLKSPIQAFRLSFLGPSAMTMINRPEYIEYVQKVNFENFVKGSQFRGKFGDLLSTNGIFVADGDVWKSQRKMASHMFSAHQFNNHVRVVIHQELGRIDALLDAVAHSAKGQSTVNLPELFFRYTLSSFSKMAFSADLDCLSADPACLERPVPFAVAFDYAQGVINERFVNPLWKIAERFSKKGKRMRESIKVIKDFGNSIIQERLKSIHSSDKGTDADSKTGGKDLLEFFIEQGLNDPDDLLVVVLNFIIAGRDTTAQALSWFFYEMMANPQHIEVIRDECEAVLGKDAAQDQQFLSYEDLRKLPYTLACINETIRLHPPVPKNGKMAVKDDVIMPQGPNPDNLPPIPVHKGEMVGWSDWVMNRLPQVWGEDAEDFLPERFLVRDDKGPVGWSYTQQSQWKFHAFNAGPRLCLGVNLAHYEALAFVAATLTKFDFHWATEAQGQKSEWPPRYANSVTHPLKVPYLCTVTPRRT